MSSPSGEYAADVVVCAIDPRRLPALAAYVDKTMPSIPPVVAYLGLEGEVPDLPAEVVLHGDPMLVVRTGGIAPEGHAAWTVHGRGKLAEDMLRALARAKIDIREQVVTRIDQSPRDLVERWGGSPHGVLWQGRGTVRHRLGPTTPIAGRVRRRRPRHPRRRPPLRRPLRCSRRPGHRSGLTWPFAVVPDESR